MFINSTNIRVQYNKSNGNDDLASLIAKDFLKNESKTIWQVLECSHETKGNFDLVLTDGSKFECFEFKSGITLNGELIFNGNQIEKSNKVYGIIFKNQDFIESIIFCQFDISLAVKRGIFNENTSGKSIRYRYKLSQNKFKMLIQDSVLISNRGNLDVKILGIYESTEIQDIIDESNDFRKNLKKLFT